MTDTDNFDNNQAAGGLLNKGTLNELDAFGVDLETDKNVDNIGVLNAVNGGGLFVLASNINIGGKIQVGGTNS